LKIWCKWSVARSFRTVTTLALCLIHLTALLQVGPMLGGHLYQMKTQYIGPHGGGDGRDGINGSFSLDQLLQLSNIIIQLIKGRMINGPFQLSIKLGNLTSEIDHLHIYRLVYYLIILIGIGIVFSHIIQQINEGANPLIR